MPERIGKHRVEWGETDAAAIVFYPNYFRWFDRATHDLFRQIGCPVEAIAERGYVIPIIEAQARFRSSLKYGDEVRVRTWISEVRTRSFRVEHEVVCGDASVARGYEIRMWVREGEAGFEPEVIPADVRALLAG